MSKAIVDNLEKFMAAHKIGIKADFIPLSRSRTATDKEHFFHGQKCLNWKVAVTVRGREVFDTDYSAGVAHCPGYNVKKPARYDRPDRFWKALSTLPP